MKWKFVFLVCCLWIMSFQTAQAQVLAPITVRISPQDVAVENGGEVDIAVEVVDVRDLYAADVLLRFDPNVLEVVDSNPGLAGAQISLGTLLEPGFVLRNEADNVDGSVWFAMTQINPSEAKSGTGNFVVIRFRSKQANASSQITLERADLVQRNGTNILTVLTPGQIQVVAQVTVPTNTPLPTQAAPTPLPTRTPQPTSSAPSPTTRSTAVSSQATATQQPPTATSVSSAATITPSSVETAIGTNVEPDTSVNSNVTDPETAVLDTSLTENSDKEGIALPTVAQNEPSQPVAEQVAELFNVETNPEAIAQTVEPTATSQPLTASAVIGEQNVPAQPISDNTSTSENDSESSSSLPVFAIVFVLLVAIIAVVVTRKRRATQSS